MENVSVFPRPRIALLSSGDELLEPGDTYRPGMTYDVNRYIFQSLAEGLPLNLEIVATLPDDRKMTGERFRELAEEYDLVITSGGISRGKFDYIRDVLSSPPFDLIIDRTAIRPGSPLMAAGLEKSLFMAMPGYPAAFLTNMVLYLLPLLRKMCGCSPYLPEVVKGILDTSMRSREGTDTFNRAELELRDGIVYARDPGTQKTSHFLSFARVSGLVYLDRETGILPRGSKVDIYLIENVF
jgi:molybdopterin molybdotransferase